MIEYFDNKMLAKLCNDEHNYMLYEVCYGDCLYKGEYIGKIQEVKGEICFLPVAPVKSITVNLEFSTTFPSLNDKPNYTKYQYEIEKILGFIESPKTWEDYLEEIANQKFKNAKAIKGVREVEVDEDWGHGKNRIREKRIYNREPDVIGNSLSLNYKEETDTLYLYGSGLCIVYENGKWAEIIE